MIGLSLTENYISNIPWVLNPALCFSDTEKAYEEAFRSVIEFVPDTNKRIRYEENVWDFRPYYEDINSPSYVIRFSKAGKDFNP